MNTTTMVRSGSRSQRDPHSSIKVFTILNGITGCEWVRIIHPWRYLNRHGISARIMPERDIPKLRYSGLPDYNVLILSRRIPKNGNVNSMLRLIDLEQSRGVKVVYEIDDDPFSVRFHHTPEELTPVFEAVDAVIVSTHQLKRRIAPYTKVAPLVVENHVDGELWDRFPRKEFQAQEITIGITGSPTHYDDWFIVSDALHRIAQKHTHVQFLSFGYTPDYLEDLPRLTALESVPYKNYPGPLKQMDIGLAPLIYDDEDFNIHKSPIKALDYMVAGAAALCSDHYVYRQVQGVRHIKDDDWFSVLDHLVTHPAELQRLQQRGEKWARKNRLLETRWTDWANALRRITKL